MHSLAVAAVAVAGHSKPAAAAAEVVDTAVVHHLCQDISAMHPVRKGY